MKELFGRAVSLRAEERQKLLDEEARDDPSLRAEVEDLLATRGPAAVDALDRLVPGPEETDLPEQIGNYRILRKIGEGGRGTVFEAEQDNPRRTVALKVIHAGILSSEAIRRFEREAQILGWLHHPGIAQIFEAHQFDSGLGVQPFFAMEFIEGKSLLAHADEKGLSISQRLDLMAGICDAAQHAHQRGVIHRDLKPGNILVNELGQPKILDFGVARATDADLQTATQQTTAGQLLGTIPYMSPEQASADRENLDARSDVYALGVVAFELLCGSMPHDLTAVILPEALRIVREDEPSRLGTRNQALRGDIETVVAMALEKEPARRYPSAAAFAADIRRFLAHEPITARPPSAMYQLSKFARRNKGLVTGLVGAFVALAVGFAGTLWGFLEAENKREGISRRESKSAMGTLRRDVRGGPGRPR